MSNVRRHRSLPRHRSPTGASFITEFPLALSILIIIVFPLINLMAASCGCATLALIAFRGAMRAADSHNFGKALQGMNQEVDQITGSGLGNFLKIRPVGGYNGCGSDLYIVTTNVFDGSESLSGANQPIAPPIDTAKNMYQFATRVCCDVGPLVSMNGIPCVKDVPGLGQPARLNFSWMRTVEHPEGLASVNNPGALQGGSSTVNLSSVTGIDTPGLLSDYTNSGWNYPNLYAMIAAAGREVTDEDVLKVLGTTDDWTPTNITYDPGQQLWIDFRSDGIWTVGQGQWSMPLTANGRNVLGLAGSLVDANGKTFPHGSLVAKVGVNGIPFFVGQGLLNYQPTSSGQLFFYQDDALPGAGYHSDNSGEQIVRVVVTR